MNIRVLRKWRRSLEEEGYITCEKKQYGQNIHINNWTDPRIRFQSDTQSDMNNVTLETQSDTQSTPQSYTQSSIKDGMPTSDSLIINHVSIAEKANKTVDAVLQFEKIAQEKLERNETYPHRDKFPEPIREFIDLYVKLTGQRPLKKDVLDWITAVQDWLDGGFMKQDIIDAYNKSKGDEKGFGSFSVTRPGSLTNTANMFAGKRRQKNVSVQQSGLERALAELRGS